jgi:hypothetical protein
MIGTRLRFGILALAVCGLVVGCASAPTAKFNVDDVEAERVDILTERVDVLLNSHGDYLLSRWPGIQLPAPAIEAWLEPGHWQPVFTQCVTREAGEGDARSLDLATYTCEARFPPPSLALTEPGPVEIAWVSEYVRSVLPSCLRRSGVLAPPLPEGPFAILSGGATPGWDPYAAARGDIAERARLQALCPHPSRLLAGIPLVPSDAVGSGSP